MIEFIALEECWIGFETMHFTVRMVFFDTFTDISIVGTNITKYGWPKNVD
ncbi:hypothetical protein BXY39_3854 [Eilatimonas milleporae]|uniref:Uncharacterized protein n=1 Tax=Eilatimonas milleporae TaxID=911205 RepID=A0A3M0C1H0_9PROT|nr:hypothetical protein BXY39_3854 [Eilatimonas milleporae]